MNQRAAFVETIALADHAGMPEHSPVDPSLGLAHLRDMYARLDPEWSDAKVGRWLGWAQAALVAANVGITLEQVKQINLRHSTT